MRSGQDHEKFLFEKHLAVQVDLIERGPQKANVNLAFAQRLILEAGEDILALDVDSGKLFAVLEYYFANQATQTGSDADPDNPGFSLLGVACGLHRMSGLHDELSRLIEKHLSCLGQRDAPLISRKEGNAQSLF
jgi:hypothetical protein